MHYPSIRPLLIPYELYRGSLTRKSCWTLKKLYLPSVSCWRVTRALEVDERLKCPQCPLFVSSSLSRKMHYLLTADSLVFIMMGHQCWGVAATVLSRSERPIVAHTFYKSLFILLYFTLTFTLLVLHSTFCGS